MTPNIYIFILVFRSELKIREEDQNLEVVFWLRHWKRQHHMPGKATPLMGFWLLLHHREAIPMQKKRNRENHQEKRMRNSKRQHRSSIPTFHWYCILCLRRRRPTFHRLYLQRHRHPQWLRSIFRQHRHIQWHRLTSQHLCNLMIPKHKITSN